MATKTRQGYSRLDREANAMRDAEAARRELVLIHDCSPAAVYALVRANRNVAHARSQLVNIGFRDSKRTARLWGVVGRVERQVDEAANRVAACFVRR